MGRLDSEGEGERESKKEQKQRAADVVVAAVEVEPRVAPRLLLVQELKLSLEVARRQRQRAVRQRKSAFVCRRYPQSLILRMKSCNVLKLCVVVGVRPAGTVCASWCGSGCVAGVVGRYGALVDDDNWSDLLRIDLKIRIFHTAIMRSLVVGWLWGRSMFRGVHHFAQQGYCAFVP